jgi:hypothetical protein
MPAREQPAFNLISFSKTTGLDPYAICRLHAVQNNLNIRTFLRRFTRLALGIQQDESKPGSGHRPVPVPLQLLAAGRPAAGTPEANT